MGQGQGQGQGQREAWETPPPRGHDCGRGWGWKPRGLGRGPREFLRGVQRAVQDWHGRHATARGESRPGASGRDWVGRRVGGRTRVLGARQGSARGRPTAAPRGRSAPAPPHPHAVSPSFPPFSGPLSFGERLSVCP